MMNLQTEKRAKILGTKMADDPVEMPWGILVPVEASEPALKESKQGQKRKMGIRPVLPGEGPKDSESKRRREAEKRPEATTWAFSKHKTPAMYSSPLMGDTRPAVTAASTHNTLSYNAAPPTPPPTGATGSLLSANSTQSLVLAIQEPVLCSAPGPGLTNIGPIQQALKEYFRAEISADIQEFRKGSQQRKVAKMAAAKQEDIVTLSATTKGFTEKSQESAQEPITEVDEKSAKQIEKTQLQQSQLEANWGLTTVNDQPTVEFDFNAPRPEPAADRVGIPAPPPSPVTISTEIKIILPWHTIAAPLLLLSFQILVPYWYSWSTRE